MTSLLGKYSLFTIHYSLLLLSFFLLAPFSLHAEYIESFDSQIEIYKDSSFNVTETIEYVFTDEKHGIFRYIPLTHPEASEHFLKERIIEVSIESVQIDGGDVAYTEEGARDQFYLKIGDSNNTITGPHTYTIVYRVTGGLSYPKGQGTEFYFNVTGNGWEVPMKRVSATIFSPDSLFLQNKSCYRDLNGSNASCDQTKQEDGSVVFRTTELMPGEGMTIAQALDTRNVEQVLLERFKILWFLVPLLALGIITLGIRLYRYKTAHRTGRTIIPQYEPYPGVKPMYTGLLMDGRLDARDITACIVYLAEQGYIKIKKTEKKALLLFEVDDYEIELLRLPDDALSQFEMSVLEMVMSAPLVKGQIVSLGELRKDQVEQQQNYREFVALQASLTYDLEKQGHYHVAPLNQKVFLLCIFFLILDLMIPIMMKSVAWTTVNLFLFPLGVIALLVFVLGRRRRTRIGYEVQDYLKGFKLFLEMTEKERYDFHNAPEKSPEQFMEYLPYAIAFGVEEKWAKVFEGITIPNPGWYDGGSVHSFSAVNLTTSLGAFSTVFAASSGASPSSGGGHSGGGSGGGGGGSW